MNKKSRFRKHLLSATFAALPIAAVAADLPDTAGSPPQAESLRPVAETSQLKSVPQTVKPASGIVQVQYEEGSPTVGYHPQNVFHATGAGSGTFTIQHSAETGMPEFVQTQYAQAQPPMRRREWRRMMAQQQAQRAGQNGGTSGAQNAAPQGGTPNMTANPSQQEERPGFFKRLFGRFGGDSEEVDDSQILPGEPAPKIPKPPAIVYETNAGSSAKGAKSPNSGVPARTASFKHQKMSTPPMVPGVDVPWNQDQPASVAQKPEPGAQANSRQQKQRAVAGVPAANDDGFVDPFHAPPVPDDESDTDTVNSADDVLLDLDSLLEKETTPRQVQRTPAEVPAARKAQIAEREADAQPETADTPAAKTEEPFTGHTIDADESLLTAEQIRNATQPAESVETDEIQAVPLLTDDSQDLKEPAMQMPVTETADDSAKAEPIFEKVPSLEDVKPSDSAEGTTLPGTDWSSKSTRALPVSQSKSAAVTRNPAPAAGSNVYVSRARREHQRYLINSRASQTGFKGFCPVELRNSRDLVDSKKEYSAKFGVATYYFSSPEALAAFEANPARYAPAASGNDVVLLVNTGEEVTGGLDFSLWYHDRLYMFRSRETQQLFSRDPSRYADQY